MKGWAKRS